MLLAELTEHSTTPPLHHSMSSFDHSVSPRQHLRRNREPELLTVLRLITNSNLLSCLIDSSGTHSAALIIDFLSIPPAQPGALV